jgi:zinc transport system ATP-binding protein
VRFGEYQALDAISLRLPEGAFMAIIGPNGAGKSTFLKALLGLLEPTSGSVRVLGNAPRSVPRESIGYVPQIKTLERSFPAVALDLVLTGLLGRWPWRVRAAERSLALGAMERTTTAHLAERPIGHLSGGELQRVYLARSLVRRPRLILLDEPASGMDALGEADMYDRLEDYQGETGATVLMITHDWQVARHHADFVFVMDRHLVSFGPPDESLTEDHLRQAFGHAGHTHPIRKGGRKTAAAGNAAVTAGAGCGGHDHGHGHDHEPDRGNDPECGGDCGGKGKGHRDHA